MIGVENLHLDGLTTDDLPLNCGKLIILKYIFLLTLFYVKTNNFKLIANFTKLCKCIFLYLRLV